MAEKSNKREEARRLDLKEHHVTKGGLIREAVLGLQDGVVSNLGIVLGVSGAIADSKIVLISGVAAVFAEAVSMFFSQYAASKSIQEFRERELDIERKEIELLPGHERQEIRDIYFDKGFRGKMLEAIVKKITSNKKVWLETMEREELTWVPPNEGKPLRDAAIVGGVAFLAGIVPVAPFAFLPVYSAILASLALVAVTLFLAGAVKTIVTGGSWLKRGAEMLLIGAISAAIGYAVGIMLGSLV